MTSKTRDSARQRLDAALGEQDRLSDRYDAAKGTSNELSAYMRLRAASGEVTARGRWLEWIVSDEYSLAPHPEGALTEDLAAR
jgi:hypothetical protein